MTEQKDILPVDLADGGVMRRNFDKNLDELNEELTLMGSMVNDAIRRSITALRDKDVDLANEVIRGDEAINAKEKDIEAMSLNILLREQPVASDLRFVTSALKMITDLERIADQAADISYLNTKLKKRNYELSDLGSIIEMAQIAMTMVEDAIAAHVNGDSELAVDVVERDLEVNGLFAKVRTEVVNDIKTEAFSAKSSLDIFLIAKYLERIGDHAENIGRRVYFSLRAEHLKN